MSDQIIAKLIENSVLLGVLGGIARMLWNRYDKFTERTMAELDNVRKQQKEYVDKDQKEVLAALNTMVQTQKKTDEVIDRNSKVMECLLPEIQDFKKSEEYIAHKRRSRLAS